MLIVSVVACELPLFNITLSKTVIGEFNVLLIVAEVFPKKVTGTNEKLHCLTVVVPPAVVPTVLFIRFPPIDIFWLVAPLYACIAAFGATLTSPYTTKFCVIVPFPYQIKAPP